jgi:hypothetical protein
MKFKSVNKLFTLIIYYKLIQVPSCETQYYYNSLFCKRNICTKGGSSGSKSSYDPVLHSHIWMPYRGEFSTTLYISESSLDMVFVSIQLCFELSRINNSVLHNI